MPLYRLLCKDCDKAIDRLCKVDESVRCRKCGKVMKRLPTQASFMLKGDGWSSDNYCKNKQR